MPRARGPGAGPRILRPTLLEQGLSRSAWNSPTGSPSPGVAAAWFSSAAAPPPLPLLTGPGYAGVRGPEHPGARAQIPTSGA